MRIWSSLGLLVLVAPLACTNERATDPASVALTPDAAADGVDIDDADHDGVCDATERRYGGNLAGDDTDLDGMPDMIELIAGFNPNDPTQPSPDQVAFLAGAPQAVLDFPARLTLEGKGQAYTGDFEPGTSLIGDDLSASDFYVGAVALAADPRENARDMAATAERFGLVDGRTRLSFRLSFRYDQPGPAPCAAAYPFLYRIRADNGSLAAARPFVLIVTSDQGSGGVAEFCMPTSCL